MNSTFNHELDLSSKLYGLIGEVYYEMSQLPTERTIDRWTRGEVYAEMMRCQDVYIRAQECAIRLSRLDTIDAYSAGWIEELLSYGDRHQADLEFVEITLLPRALDDGTLWRRGGRGDTEPLYDRDEESLRTHPLSRCSGLKRSAG